MKTGITLEEALAIVREHTAPLPPEQGWGEELLGRVLAENIIAPMDQPPFDRFPPGWLRPCFCRHPRGGPGPPRPAGGGGHGVRRGWLQVTIRPGQCVRIMTGAPIPAGADCVIRQEDTDLGHPCVQIYQELAAP